jgi:DtxR family transcriptional regulator, Mn-dependent transcriptional regulator
MTEKVELSEIFEDYLEAILELQETKRVARSKDIADRLNIKPGSLTANLKKLSEIKLINYEPYGYITLTPKGKEIAREIESRHIFLKDFFFRIIGLEEDIAEKTACRIEHAMDRETFRKFKKFIIGVEKRRFKHEL